MPKATAWHYTHSLLLQELHTVVGIRSLSSVLKEEGEEEKREGGRIGKRKKIGGKWLRRYMYVGGEKYLRHFLCLWGNLYPGEGIH